MISITKIKEKRKKNLPKPKTIFEIKEEKGKEKKLQMQKKPLPLPLPLKGKNVGFLKVASHGKATETKKKKKLQENLLKDPLRYQSRFKTRWGVRFIPHIGVNRSRRVMQL